jgi:cytochrome c oxidase subunit 2
MGIPFFLAANTTSPENLSIFDPVTPPGVSIRHLFILVLAITGGIFILVEGVLLYSMFRFRRSPSAPRSEPPQVYGSTPIEIAWTAAPALIVFVLLLVIVRTDIEVEKPPPTPTEGDNALFVRVIGHQWWWEYVYQHYDGKELRFITANEMCVPAGTQDKAAPIYLTVESADVCHSWWVPRLAGKMDLIPGRKNYLWFQTAKPVADPDMGDLFLGQCAEYCGTQHANMLLRVRVQTPERFRKWLQEQSEPAREPSGQESAEAAGKALFLGQSCRDCHRIRGTSAQGTYAPDLTHLASRETLEAGMRPLNREELLAWVVNPQKAKPGCLMPGFGLTDKQFDDLTAYLMSLK